MAQVTINRDTRCFSSKSTPTVAVQQKEGTTVVHHANTSEISVQAVVERVKDDFHSLHFCNEKLRRCVNQKVSTEYGNMMKIFLNDSVTETTYARHSKENRRVLHSS